jgi:hypothetical protein
MKGYLWVKRIKNIYIYEGSIIKPTKHCLKKEGTEEVRGELLYACMELSQ